MKRKDIASNPGRISDSLTKIQELNYHLKLFSGQSDTHPLIQCFNPNPKLLGAMVPSPKTSE
jgi:hypothetical protein